MKDVNADALSELMSGEEEAFVDWMLEAIVSFAASFEVPIYPVNAS